MISMHGDIISLLFRPFSLRFSAFICQIWHPFMLIWQPRAGFIDWGRTRRKLLHTHTYQCLHHPFGLWDDHSQVWLASRRRQRRRFGRDDLVQAASTGRAHEPVHCWKAIQRNERNGWEGKSKLSLHCASKRYFQRLLKFILSWKHKAPEFRSIWRPRGGGKWGGRLRWRKYGHLLYRR